MLASCTGSGSRIHHPIWQSEQPVFVRVHGGTLLGGGPMCFVCTSGQGDVAALKAAVCCNVAYALYTVSD